MRGFQIWSQNSNPITFDPLFGQKMAVENWQNTLFCLFFFAAMTVSQDIGGSGKVVGMT